MKISIKTLGCRLNQAESDKIAQELINFGIEVDCSFKNKSDLYIINTCCITEKAVTKSRREINKIKNINSRAIIIGCGCAKDLKPEVNLFIDNKKDISETIYNKFVKNKNYIHKDVDYGLIKNHTRAFIKIQDGCNNYCTYCIIPYIRNKMISISCSNILTEIKEKEKYGFKEIVLTGVNIGKYKNKNIDLVNLVENILKKTSIQRIRFSSMNPDHISNKFISLFRNQRICHHLHLSLQSGSDSVLKRMGRNYDTKEYLDITKKIYSKYPDFNFTTDIIVGFPGETDKEFKDSYKFIEKIGFSKIHTFPYSRRKRTVADRMKNQLKYLVKKERMNILSKINKKLRDNFNNKMIGKKEEILFEGRKNNCYSGFTKNYFKVNLKSERNLKNKEKIIKISKNNLTI